MEGALKFEKAFAYALYFSGLYAIFKAIKRGSRDTRILTYHRVGSGKMVTKESFGKQMAYLSKNYNAISFSEFLKGMKDGTIKKRSVVITLDDGYTDNYTDAYPILKKHGIPATIFPIAGSIGKDGMLGWSEMKEMEKGGLVTFGAHTLTHPRLSGCSKADAKKEILESKKMLESQLGKIDVFAYPYGGRADFNGETKQIVKGSFSAAVTTIPGLNNPSTDVFELKRIGCSHENSIIVFKVKVSGMLNPFIRLYRKGG